VLKTIVQRAVQLAGLDGGSIYEFDERDQGFHLRAAEHVEEKILEVSRSSPIRLGEGAVGRAGATREPVVVEDVLHESYQSRVRELLIKSGSRAVLAVPLVREDLLLGALVVYRNSPGPFAPEVIELLKTFAAQSAVAIQNARLFNETKEALAQQTASSKVLEVISGSPSDLKPVFDAILASATGLCEAHLAVLNLYDGSAYRTVAQLGTSKEFSEWLLNSGPFRPDPTTSWARVARDRQPLQVGDLRESAAYREGVQYAIKFADMGGARTYLIVPLVKDERFLGAIAIFRPEVKVFSDKQVELVKTFARQAVIAMENVRLFNEMKEALEQQKASADVLAVISSSIADTTPVFEKILDSCQRLFAGRNVGINIVGDDGKVHIGAYKGEGRTALETYFPVPLSMESGSGAAILLREVVHYPDCDAPDVPAYARRSGRVLDIRSVLFAPMLWEGKGVGAIFVGRTVSGAFSEKEIALLKTFADQAAIAIQNARLFREIQQKSAQLQVANQHKSEFLANMSHELRTPLNAIIGFSEAMMEQMFGELNEKQLEYQKDINESGKHLLSLINDILDLSKIEAGRMELELSSFHLPTAVANAVTLIRERAQRHGIALGVEIDERLGEFRADERKVKQILLNLLSNAVKFTPDGGRVDVSGKLVADKVEISVKDSGVGIRSDDQASLFEEFKQLGKDSGRKAEGTGLGLSLTKRLVELHGGHISVESAVGQGSTFCVAFPLRA
jgi:signal transduction histidine kinase